MTVKQIDDLLPQTQCQLCGYDGCRPYAEAIINNNEEINKCLPGGLAVMQSISKITQHRIVEEYPEYKKPISKVQIDIENCIGCTKCIQACPVDAISGASKSMHYVLSDICTGCDLCIPACPVDCIDPIASSSLPDPLYLKEAFTRRNERVTNELHSISNERIKSNERSVVASLDIINQALANAKKLKGHTLEEV
jgi:electron transport complex protein RnfB